MQAALKQYEVQPNALWQSVFCYDGYEVMEIVERRGWHVISAWGSKGWDLGSWPLVMIFFQNMKKAGLEEIRYRLAYYVEGDIQLYDCPTIEIREAIIDELAYFHWKAWEQEWVKDYESVDQLPDTLRGPYRQSRSKAS